MQPTFKGKYSSSIIYRSIDPGLSYVIFRNCPDVVGWTQRPIYDLSIGINGDREVVEITTGNGTWPQDWGNHWTPSLWEKPAVQEAYETQHPIEFEYSPYYEETEDE